MHPNEPSPVLIDHIIGLAIKVHRKPGPGLPEIEAVAGDNLKWPTCYSFSVCGAIFATEAAAESYRKQDVAGPNSCWPKQGIAGRRSSSSARRNCRRLVRWRKSRWQRYATPG